MWEQYVPAITLQATGLTDLEISGPVAAGRVRQHRYNRALQLVAGFSYHLHRRAYPVDNGLQSRLRL